MSQIRLAQALAMAASLPPNETEEDIVCPNATQNILVVSTPTEKNANAYAGIHKLHLREGAYNVAAYIAAPDNTCKGVIRGVDPEINEAQLQAMIVNQRNPKALEAKRIKNTSTVVVLFDGMKVPNYIMCGVSLIRCTLYKRQTTCATGAVTWATESTCVQILTRRGAAAAESTTRLKTTSARPSAPFAGANTRRRTTSASNDTKSLTSCGAGGADAEMPRNRGCKASRNRWKVDHAIPAWQAPPDGDVRQRRHYDSAADREAVPSPGGAPAPKCAFKRGRPGRTGPGQSRNRNHNQR